MIIPNAERAVVGIQKLRGYCLNLEHDEGKHKARVFAAALNMTADDAGALAAILLQAVRTHEATLGRRDLCGQRYLVDFTLEWRGKRGQIRSGWIIEPHSATPRLTTCYLV